MGAPRRASTRSWKSAPHPINDRYVTTREAADFLGVAPGTLANWRVLGCGPNFVKLNSSVRYAASTLATFAAARSRSSTSAEAGV